MLDLIYLDNNSTTRVDPIVLEKMIPFLSNAYGNPLSTQYALGRTANQALEEARNNIADILNCSPSEIIFTSGATESINMALRGIYENYQTKGNHIITAASEHKAVLSTLHYLEKKGAHVTYLPVDQNGNIDLDQLSNAITDKTILVCIMAANNETGVIHPIDMIGEVCRNKNTLFFCDATQWVGKKEIDLHNSSIDLLCFSSHKHHGPKGIGILYKRNKRRPIQIPSLIAGGLQEYNMRGGTHNIASIVGMQVALQLADGQKDKLHSIEEMRNYLEEQLTERIEHIIINGKQSLRINNTSNITFKYARGSEIILNSPKLAMSTGSACVTGTRDPSHVLKSMGLNDEDCYSTLRFSLSKWTTQQEVDSAVEILRRSVSKIREESPLWSMFKQGIID